MHQRLPIVLALAGTLSLLAGCSPEPEPGSSANTAKTTDTADITATTQPVPSIEGPGWRLIPADGGAPVAMVRFEAGRVHGFGGCNQFTGAYTIEGDQVKLDSLASTMMACDAAVMEAESTFLAALGGAHRLSFDAGQLTLAAMSNAGARLVFEPVPTPSLGGVTWDVTGFNNGRQAVVSPLTGTTLQLSFEDGAVVGHAGCNRFRAAYQQDGNSLSIEPPAATRMFCDGEGIMEQEQQFLDALATATTWTIERGLLDVHRADGERVLTARAAED